MNTRVLALAGMTPYAFMLLAGSLAQKKPASHPIDLLVYSDSKTNHIIDSRSVIRAMELVYYTKPSKIVLGKGMLMMEDLYEIFKWMFENRNQGLFLNLQSIQISDHHIAEVTNGYSYSVLQMRIKNYLTHICTDKENFPNLSLINLNGNNEVHTSSYDSTWFYSNLTSSCNLAISGVTILADPTTIVVYPPICTTSNTDYDEYYMSINRTEQCRKNWSWEVSMPDIMYTERGPWGVDEPNYYYFDSSFQSNAVDSPSIFSSPIFDPFIMGK